MSRYSDAVVAVSKGAADAFNRLVPIKSHKITVIPNGSDLKAIQALADEQMSKEDEELFRVPTIVAVGRLSKEKNHQLLIRIHAAIRKNGLFHRLLILGEGNLFYDLQSLAKAPRSPRYSSFSWVQI